jgi:hypothetical protein
MSGKQKKVLKKPKNVAQNTENDNTKEEIDYLTEDPVISDQLFVCVSFLKPSSIAEKYRPNDLSVCGFKVRGSYGSYDEAKARADFLNKCDPYHNVYVAEVGKWCPFEDDPEKAKDNEYMNKDLNKLMKNYWKQQSDAKEYHELRKQDMIKKALEDVNKRKEENTTNADADEQSEAEHTKTAKKKKSKTKTAKLEEMKSELETGKTDLDNEKKEVDENINTLRRLEEELAEKIKEMEQEQLRNMSLNGSTQQEQSQSQVDQSS